MSTPRDRLLIDAERLAALPRERLVVLAAGRRDDFAAAGEQQVMARGIAMLFALGAASIAFRAVASTYVQLTANPEMRGRVIALLLIAFTGTTPLGDPLIRLDRRTGGGASRTRRRRHLRLHPPRLRPATRCHSYLDRRTS